LCTELLAEYIAVSNEIVETRQQLHTTRQPAARELASSLIDNALRRRSKARKELFIHKEKRH
jgi:hypothetical protein